VDRVLLRAPELAKCLYFFSNHAEFVPSFNGYDIRVFRSSRDKWIYFKTFKVTNIEAGYFFQYNMYNERFDFDGYDKVKYAKIEYAFVLPPMRERTDDGQLKILVDCMLAVDTLVTLNKELKIESPVTVLVAGSTSGTLTSGGESYQVIPHMIPTLSIELVDPNEFSMEYMVEGLVSTHVTHKSKTHSYEKRHYDLVLDDVFLEVIKPMFHDAARDPDDLLSEYARVFSIKAFPWSGTRYANRYYQAVKTSSRELRRVSHSRYPNYRNVDRLGNCSMCNELKFYLKNDYDDNVYDFFLRMHKRNCVTGELRNLVSFYKPIDIKFEIVDSDVFEIIKSVYRFSWDRGLEEYPGSFENLEIAQLNSNLLSRTCVIVSDFQYVPTNFFPIIRRLVCVSNVPGGYKLQFRGSPDDYRDSLRFRIDIYDICSALTKTSYRSKDGYNPLKDSGNKWRDRDRDKEKYNYVVDKSKNKIRIWRHKIDPDLEI